MTVTETPVQFDGRRYASEVDTERHGEYRVVRDPDDPRPLYRFRGRLVDASDQYPDQQHGETVFRAEAGRYHLYSGWFCPWAHRATLVLSIAGLSQAVSVSYVDGARDGRGWAFREATGPDPVNGFTLLREAYEATEPGFDGHVSVPTLWDRHSKQVVTNDYATLDADLARRFQAHSATGIHLYPEDLRPEIDELDRWLGPTVNHGVHRAAGRGGEARLAADRVRAAFTALEKTFAHSRYLLGDRLTLADLRLFVTLVRYDTGPNVGRRIGPALPDHPHLWAYARGLYQRPDVRATTRIETFTAPGAQVPDWDAPVTRDLRAS